MRNLLSELKRRKVFRVAAMYVLASWLLLQVADVLASILELPPWAGKLVFFVLVIGFVPAMVLAWAYDLTPDGVSVTPNHDGSAAQSSKRPVAQAAFLLLLGVAAAGWWYSGKDARWAQDAAIPGVEDYVELGDLEAAYALALQVEERLPGDPEMAEIWSSFTWKTSIPSSPPGVRVYRRPYENPDAAWQYLGITPIYDTRIPFGASVLRFEAEGLAPMQRVIGGGILGEAELLIEEPPWAGFANVNPGGFRLYAEDSLPAGMVHVPGWQEVMDGNVVVFRDFFLGKYEVTNAEFQSFVDAGGYRREDLWEHDFLDGGAVLSFDDAMARFVDRTGRPGPSNWDAGSYPDGTAGFPVTGISWYEAAAYARFAGFELPTLGHWRRALATGLLAFEIPATNVNGNGPVAVGSRAGIGWTGTFDMAGNAREWCYNEVDDGQRVILGGGWDDDAYVVESSVSDPHRLPPMDRSATNGLRLMSWNEEAATTRIAMRPIVVVDLLPIPDPVSDEVFDVKRRDFDYDHTPLNASIEETVEFRHWRRQRVTLDGEAGEERITLLVYLPHGDASRYQTVLFWPGAGTQFMGSIDDYQFPLDFILRNGRAVAFPLLNGTFERRMPKVPDWTTHAGRNLAAKEVREFRRMIDYLETRTDIQADKFAYYGKSWGGRMGAIVLAVEPRIRVAILNQAGINAGDHPDINVAHFLPRVTVPVLHFSGRYDTDFRFESSSRPFFERLGTKEADKRHVVSPTGHFVPRSAATGETLDWLDKYVGPVE
jgi:formylglycine-generating enzyme required for sulfatase activity